MRSEPNFLDSTIIRSAIRGTEGNRDDIFSLAYQMNIHKEEGKVDN